MHEIKSALSLRTINTRTAFYAKFLLLSGHGRLDHVRNIWASTTSIKARKHTFTRAVKRPQRTWIAAARCVWCYVRGVIQTGIVDCPARLITVALTAAMVPHAKPTQWFTVCSSFGWRRNCACTVRMDVSSKRKKMHPNHGCHYRLLSTVFANRGTNVCWLEWQVLVGKDEIDREND